jgi:acetyl esterase/lipase
MKTFLMLMAISISACCSAMAQNVVRDIPYSDLAHERQVLDVYSPAKATNAPVVFWIHGGGWQGGDKTMVKHKPQFFTDNNYVFVTTNYRLFPSVAMEAIVADIAKSIRWVHDHIAEYGGDPKRIFVMGHSAGAQLAALVCTDDRYLKAEGLGLDILKGCVPVDGDTYDIPAMITVAEIRCMVHKQPLPTEYGHRQKFGNDPKKHIDFSAVTHVKRGIGIPPFMLLFVRDHADTNAQAQRLGSVLNEAGVRTTLVAGKDTNHDQINDNLGLPGDPNTLSLLKFLGEAMAK